MTRDDLAKGPDTGSSLDEAVERVYADLKRVAVRQMAGERKSHTLQATALVHEAYVRLLANDDIRWQNQGQFLGMAARVMRQVLVDHARKRSAEKRGGDLKRVTLYEDETPDEALSFSVLELHDALEKLARHDKAMAQLVELRFFAGLNHHDTMQALGQSRRTLDKNWASARAWLTRELGSDGNGV